MHEEIIDTISKKPGSDISRPEIEYLLETVGTSAASDRKTAVEVLSRIGWEHPAKLERTDLIRLTDGLLDGDSSVRNATAEAITTIGNQRQEALEIIMSYLTEGMDAGTPTTQKECVAKAGFLGDYDVEFFSDVIDPLVRCMESEHDEVRITAQNVLNRMYRSHSSAIPLDSINQMAPHSGRADSSGWGWGMYQRDPQRTGQAPSPGPVTEPRCNWTRQTNGWCKSIIAYDGLIYYTDSEDRLVALDSKGNQKWSHDLTDSWTEITDVYCALDPIVETLYAVVDAQSPYPETAVVKFSIDGNKEDEFRAVGCPLANRERSFLPVDGRFFHLTLDQPPERINVREEFRALYGEYHGRAWTMGIAYDDGALFLLSGRSVGRLNPVTENFEWETELSDVEPRINHHDSSYIGVRGETVFVNNCGWLYGINRDTAEIMWRVPHDPSFSPVLGDDYIYTRVDGEIVALESGSQDEVWRFTSQEAPLVAPIVGGDFLYTGEYQAGNCRLFGLDRHTGEQIWELSGLSDLYRIILADDRLIAKTGQKIAAIGTA